MKTIFLFIPNYVYSSDFLRTNYIKYLVTKFRVVVFAPDGLFEGNKPYFQSPNLIYIPWNIRYPKFWILFGKFLRYCLIRKYDFEPVVKRGRKKGMKDWRRRVLRPFSYLFPKNLITPKLFTKIEVALFPRVEEFSKYIEKYQPAIVVTPTPGFTHFDAEAIVMAKKFGILTAAVNFSWDNLHNGGAHFRQPDFLIVWNDIIKEVAIKNYGYPPDKVFVSGIMRLDHYFADQPEKLSREAFLVSKGLSPDRKTILVTTVTDGNYPLENLLIKELIRARDGQRIKGCPNIFIRLHPKDSYDKYKNFLAEENVALETAGSERIVDLGNRIEIDEKDLINLKYTLDYCDVVINYASTMTLEAFVFDKPTINIGYPPEYLNAYIFTHYKPIVAQGAVRLVKNFDELVGQVNYYIDDPSADKNNRQHIFERFIQFNDGNSCKRNVDFLVKIIEKNE